MNTCILIFISSPLRIDNYVDRVPEGESWRYDSPFSLHLWFLVKYLCISRTNCRDMWWVVMTMVNHTLFLCGSAMTHPCIKADYGLSVGQLKLERKRWIIVCNNNSKLELETSQKGEKWTCVNQMKSELYIALESLLWTLVCSLTWTWRDRPCVWLCKLYHYQNLILRSLLLGFWRVGSEIIAV